MTKDDWENIINDAASYARLYTGYYKKFYNYGKKFTASTSLIEDAIQEVFLNTWAKKENLRQVISINAYFFASFRYTLLKKLKEQKRTVTGHDIDAEPAFSADALMIKKEMDQELKHTLKNAFETLTPRQREAIFLRFYQNLSYEEVSGILGITIKATYKIIARSLSALKDHMTVAIVCLLNFIQLNFFENNL